jgi:hypothetical protein
VKSGWVGGAWDAGHRVHHCQHHLILQALFLSILFFTAIFLCKLFNTASSAAPKIPLSRRMVGLNPEMKGKCDIPLLLGVKVGLNWFEWNLPSYKTR